MPSSSIRLSSKCERVPTSRYVLRSSQPHRASLNITPSYRNSFGAYNYDDYRATNFNCQSHPVVNYEEGGGRNYVSRRVTNGCVPRYVNHDPAARVDGKSRTPFSRSKLNLSESNAVENKRRPINVSEIDEDKFCEELISRSEPKSRSCRRWSQADTLAIDATRAYSMQNGFRIGDRVSADGYVGSQLPYAALQSIEPMSMPYNPAPPIPAPPRNPDRCFSKAANLRRRSARSVSPESRKNETEAREKRLQIAHNLRQYVDQRRKGMVGCKSNTDLLNSSESDFWKKDDLNEKVSDPLTL